MKQDFRKTTPLSVILCGAAAVIMTIYAVLHVIFGESPLGLVALSVICALVWWVAFAVQAVRWRRGKREQK